MKKRPTLSFSDSRKLVNTTFESALRGAKAFTKAANGWTEAAQQAGLFIDMSKVTWCEQNACARLILFVERALRDGLQVTVALPNPCVLVNEQKWLGESVRHACAKRRHKALKFLQNMNFQDALACHHIQKSQGQLEILERYDRSDDSNHDEHLVNQAVEHEERNLEDEKRRRKQIIALMPLQWIKVDDENLDNVQKNIDTVKEAISVLTHETRGIFTLDAKAFVNVLFYELMSNVHDHAKVTHCLIGIWARNTGQYLDESDYPKNEQPFFKNWIEPNRFPLVDIVLGDSGCGIHTVLKDAYACETPPHEGVPEEVKGYDESILFWSLGRWSSSRAETERRGTRGLYRVHRLVKGYNGLLTLRAGTAKVGWNHGGLSLREPIFDSGLPMLPGTVALIRFAATPQQVTRNFVTTQLKQSHNIDFVLSPEICINASGLVKKSQEVLRSLLAKKQTNQARCVIAVLGELPAQIEASKQGFEHALEQLGDMNNPGALVLLAPSISPSELDVYVNSVSEQLAKDHNCRSICARPDNLDVSDPFFVIDRNAEAHWVGIFESEIVFFKKLTELALKGQHISKTQLQQIFPNPRQQRTLLVELQQQEDLFVFNEKEEPALRFSVRECLNFFENNIAQRLDDIIQNDPLRNENGVNDGFFMSPSLCIVNKWVDSERILEKFGWFEATPEVVENNNLSKNIKQVLHQLAGRVWFTYQHFIKDLASYTSCDSLYTKSLLRKLLQHRGLLFPLHALGIKIISAKEHKVPDYVVCDTHSSMEIATGIGAWLGTQKIISLPALPRLDDESEVWEPIDERNMIIYVDVILTGNSTRQILNKIIKSGGVPIAIACLYDFRSIAENGKPIRESGFEVSVIALVSCSNLIQTEEKIKYKVINAQSEKPQSLETDMPHLDYPLSQEQFLSYSCKENALLFNHFIGNNGEHFTFHLLFKRIFKSTQFLQDARQVITNTAQHFSNEIKDYLPQETVAVYVNRELPDEEITALLSSTKCKNVTAVNRLNHGIEFDIPTTVYGNHTIAFLWDAVTGGSASRLTYQLAAAGAKSVLTFICVSRMEPRQEQVLRAIHSMFVTVPKADNPQQDLAQAVLVEEKTIPVRIVPLSFAALQSFGEHECPICQFRKRIDLELKKFPSIHLKTISEEIIASLKPKNINQLPTDETDCYGSKLTAMEYTEMFRLRNLFHRAIKNTEARLEVQHKLNEILRILKNNETNKSASVSSLISLLATELRWFKMPPLNFSMVRDILSEIAWQVLQQDTYASTNLRREAIICLRASDKRRFAKTLAELANNFHKNEILLKQLLYDAYTYLGQEHHQHKEFLIPLTDSLKAIVDIEDEQQADNQFPFNSVAQAIYALALRKLNVLDDSQNKITLPEYWQKLKQFYKEQFANGHEKLPKSISSLFPNPQLEAVWKDQRKPIASADYWTGTRRKWEKAHVLMEKALFPHLRHLRGLFNTTFATDTFGFNALDFIFDLCSTSTNTDLTELNDLLTQFSQEPPQAKSDDWIRFRALREQFRDILMAMPNEQGDEGALLYYFSQTCPCSLIDAIRKIENNPTFSEKSDFRILVEEVENIFCHEAILDELFEETIDNALIMHRHPNNTARPCIGIFISILQEENKAVLRILNTGSDPNYRAKEGEGGNGLSRIAWMLAPYDAKLEHGVSLEKDWDYEVKVTFLLGVE